ncbi:hypothetical protein BDE02_08G202800 [Populus trichocarpa]|nr:hypothetical protein BDE02_08G202800 [Populus trichocarpa]
MRLCVHATTIPTSEPRQREQVETPERDRARTAGREGSRRDKQQAGREGSRRDKRQAAGGNDGDNHAGGCLPRLGRRRPGLGSRHVTPRGRGLRGEPTHGRAHGNLMPRPRQRRALLAIPELGGPPQPRRPGLQLASTGSGHRSRTRRISKGQGTGRGGNYGDNHAGGCQPRLGRQRPGLGSGHITPRGRGLQGEPTHGRAHDNLMPRPRQRRALLAIPQLGGPHQPRQPGLRLASRGSGHRRRDVAASRRSRSRCQHLGTSTANECHAHAADKQPQRARRLGAGPEDGGRNRVECGNPGSSPAAASDVGLAPAAPSLSHAGGRPERGGPGPEGSPPRAREQASRGCRLPRPATSGWPLQRLASPPQGAGQNAGGQGPKAAPPRASEQASRGCRLPRPATSGWPLQRLASPPKGAGQNAGGQGPKAVRDGEQASRGSPCFRQPSMAAGAAGRHARAPKRPRAQEPKGPQGPQALRPQRPSAQRGRAGARARVNFSLPAAQVRTRISPPRQQANTAEADTAAESADTVPRAATAPVSKPAVFLVEPWTIQPVQTHRQHLLPILPISSALPIPPLPPPCLNQRCFVSVSRGRIFLPGLDSPSSSPCSSKNLRCRFSPTNLQLRKYALPIPPVGMAAAAPIMSGPTVFFVKPWTIQSVQTHRQPILSTLLILSALPIPTLPPVSKPALFRQLFP